MTDLADLLDRMTVTVRSPDRSVTVSCAFDGSCTVELAPGTLRRHSEESLSRQLSALVRVGVAALHRGYDEAARRALPHLEL